MKTRNNIKFLQRLKSLLSNQLAKSNASLIIEEIEEQEQTELLSKIKFQLQSPTFLREWCINEIEIEISKNN
jgi:hypothetical protein